MKKSVVAIAMVSIAFFAACGNGADNTNETQNQEAVSEYSLEESAESGVNLGTNSGEMIDPSAAPTGGSGEVRLNPPHGEPGHRCEIPVGAPLDSDPGNAAGLIQQQMIQDHAPAQQTPSGGQNQRLNPPHGQPGHDCNVPVGAPLP